MHRVPAIVGTWPARPPGAAIGDVNPVQGMSGRPNPCSKRGRIHETRDRLTGSSPLRAAPWRRRPRSSRSPGEPDTGRRGPGRWMDQVGRYARCETPKRRWPSSGLIAPTGELDDVKISCPVRRGAAETEPYSHRADRLPYAFCPVLVHNGLPGQWPGNRLICHDICPIRLRHMSSEALDETTLSALPPPDAEAASPRRTPLLPERSDFLEGDAPAADKVQAFLARAPEATGSDAPPPPGPSCRGSATRCSRTTRSKPTAAISWTSCGTCRPRA